MSPQPIFDVPTMAEVNATRQACPKGAQPSRLEAEKPLTPAKFRDAVWLRDASTCRICRRVCDRSAPKDYDASGHVHHVRGRNVAPEDRTNVAAALLLCRLCHLKAHAKTVKVPKP